jgi:hypothetical protein
VLVLRIPASSNAPHMRQSPGKLVQKISGYRADKCLELSKNRRLLHLRANRRFRRVIAGTVGSFHVPFSAVSKQGGARSTRCQTAIVSAELAEACRKKERVRGEALFAEQCRHHSALNWTEPRRPKWLDVPEEILPPDDSEHEITDEEREAFCRELRRLREMLQHSSSSRKER